MIDRTHTLPVARQCQLLKLARSTAYYQPRSVSDTALALMRRIDELHLQYPFAGARMLRDILRREGHGVGRRHVATLMRRMGITAIYRMPRTSQRHPAHRIYPYLLRQLTITRPNHVWAADITYIAMRRGFVYLCAIMDWASRRVLAWRLSNTLTTDFCVEAVQEALTRYGCPEIFNTDQGCQFTSEEWTERLKELEVKISMDGRRRWMDNVFIERLWRSVKYEDIYLREYATLPALHAGLKRWFNRYNSWRPHAALGNLTPEAVYQNPSTTKPAVSELKNRRRAA